MKRKNSLIDYKTHKQWFNDLLNQYPSNGIDHQRKRILKALRKFKGITSFELNRYLDVYYPPARVKELRHDFDKNIITHWVACDTKENRPKRVAKYVLKPGKFKGVKHG